MIDKIKANPILEGPFDKNKTIKQRDSILGG